MEWSHCPPTAVNHSHPRRWPSVGAPSALASGPPRWADIGILARVDQVLGHLAQLDVEVLGGPTQDVERLLGRDALTLHEDAHGLTDRLAARQCGVEVGLPALLVLMGA